MCGFVITGTQRERTDTHTHSHTQPRTQGRSHDTLGKGELAVATENEQISRVNINVQLGLQPFLFFVKVCFVFCFFSLLLPVSFFMSCSTLPSTLQFDRTINKQGFMLLPLPTARFSVFLFLICEDKQPRTSSIAAAAAATAAARHHHIYDSKRLSLRLRSHCCTAGKETQRELLVKCIAAFYVP